MNILRESASVILTQRNIVVKKFKFKLPPLSQIREW